MVDKISYEVYSEVCNGIIGWCNTNGKLIGLKLRNIYGTVDNITADLLRF